MNDYNLPQGQEPHLTRYLHFIQTRPIRSTQKGCGFELHHILPRSLGGLNNPPNIIKLTCREHFLAHLILYKTYGKSLSTAFFLMSRITRYQAKLSSRQYEEVREAYRKKKSIWRREHPLSEESKRKISESRKGIKLSEEACARMAATKRSRPLTKRQMTQLERLHNSKEKMEKCELP